MLRVLSALYSGKPDALLIDAESELGGEYVNKEYEKRELDSMADEVMREIKSKYGAM